jgi:serine/threonine-protein kinase TTK/MPS1
VDLRDIRDKAIRDTFFKEVAVIEELNKQGCQHIIRLLEWEYNENDMMLYIVMEKGDMDLHTLLKEEGKPPMWKIKTFWDAMLRAVQEIHRFKIIHSDLKPANFIVMNRYALKLIDFGIADKIENEKTSIERTLEKGTPNYMAPEAIRASYHGKAQIKVKVDTHIHRHLIHRYICDPLCLCIRWGQLVMSGLLDVFFTHCFMEVLLLAMLSS